MGPLLKILISGATGLVGAALSAFLTTGGHSVTRLVRGQPHPGARDIAWDPRHGVQDLASLEGVDAVIHLAGENIAGRWTAEKRARIRDSRETGTKLSVMRWRNFPPLPKSWSVRPRLGTTGIVATRC